MTAEEQYKVALNIASRVGLNGNLIQEYAKTMAFYNGYNSQKQMQAMNDMTRMGNIGGTSGQMSSQPYQSATQTNPSLQEAIPGQGGSLVLPPQ